MQQQLASESGLVLFTNHGFIFQNRVSENTLDATDTKMKTHIFLVAIAFFIVAFANAAGPQEPAFAAMTAEYWCKYQTQPRTVKDIEAIQGSTKGVDPQLLKDLQAYLNRITVKGNLEHVTITYDKPHPSGDPKLMGQVKAEMECNKKASNKALKKGTPQSGAP